ncbi:MAG: glutathione S-transferase family protein [Nitrospiria bacterium]
MKLYNLESCFFCKMVRDKLDLLGLEYEKVEVPLWHWDRREVFDISGQYLVPVLVDNNLVLDDEEKILPYLEETYGHPS